MSTITSGGIERDKRVHQLSPHEWGCNPATDYWANFNEADLAAAGGKDLADDGWDASGFSYLAGSGAALLSTTTQGTTGGLNFDGFGDYLISPHIFGDWAHALLAQQFLGYFPTTLNMECVARFAAVIDEEATGFGFVQDGTDVNALVKADWMAGITVDGTNFSLESSAGADAGSTKATTPHLFKITGTFGSTWEWFIDGTSQGTLAVVANQGPMAWAVGTKAADGTNDPVISWVHIWYE